MVCPVLFGIITSLKICSGLYDIYNATSANIWEQKYCKLILGIFYPCSPKYYHAYCLLALSAYNWPHCCLRWYTYSPSQMTSVNITRGDNQKNGWRVPVLLHNMPTKSGLYIIKLSQSVFKLCSAQKSSTSIVGQTHITDANICQC